MKKIFLSLAMVSVTFALAQKKEVTAAFKAAESGDAANAASQIAAADAILKDRIYLLEPSLQEQYYYAKGYSLIKSGNTAEGANYLSKINDLAKMKIYVGKDANKDKVYFVGKADAEASKIAGLKEETYTLTTGSKVGMLINPLLTSTNQQALDAFNGKKYDLAGDKFLETYKLLKAAGQNNGQFLYNAGLSYAMAEKNDKAIKVYEELLNIAYTGVETTYKAKDKKTGQVSSFDKSSWEIMKKNPDYTDFKTETSPSIEKELYETYAALLAESGKTEDALAFIETALKKFPGNSKLSQLQGNVYFKSGKMNEFIGNLKTQLAANPNDALNWYNLGVLQSKDSSTVGDAEISFKKAIELDPKMANAYQNMVYITMGDDEKTLDEYERLRKSGKMEQANKILESRRERFRKALPYAEKLYTLDENNLDVVSLLKGLYTTTHNDAKAAEFKAKEAALKAKGK